MTPGRPEPSRYRSLDASRRALARSAPLVRFGLFAVGVSVFLDRVEPLLSDAQFTWAERRVMGVVGLITLGGFGLAGWLAGRLLSAAADLIEVFVEAAEASVESAYLIDARLVPAFARAAVALEKMAEGAELPGRNAALAVRGAIGEGRWGRAEQLLQNLKRDDPEAPALTAELCRARQIEADDLRARLDAARATGDVDRVIDCRDALTVHLRGDPLHDLDRRVVRWVADQVQARARSGEATPALASLAERAADSFGDTAEGAALLAALPALRRRAGLCPDCARPYRGKADACPDCRPAPTPRQSTTPGGSIPRGTP